MVVISTNCVCQSSTCISVVIMAGRLVYRKEDYVVFFILAVFPDLDLATFEVNINYDNVIPEEQFFFFLLIF